jgi:hypothetical protein
MFYDLGIILSGRAEVTQPRTVLLFRFRFAQVDQSAYSGVIRPLIPKVSGHPFRFYPATDSGASGHPVM